MSRAGTLLGLLVLVAACSGDRKDAGVTRTARALSTESPVPAAGATPSSSSSSSPSPSVSSSSSASSEALAAVPIVARSEKVVARGRCDRAAEGATKGPLRFTLAHLNDLQARYSDRLAGRSRYAYIAGYLEKLRAETPETLVLDAGDDYEKGALAELRSHGETTRRMVQALPIDVRTIGNHDFAYGEEAVLRDVRESAHPVLAANVRHPGFADDAQPFRRFVRIDVGCVRVGVIGLVTQNYDADDRPTKKPFAGVFEHSDKYAAILQRELEAHRAEVDVMIALTHLGYWEDTLLATSAGAKGLDLVVGAHTEDLLRQPMAAMRGDGSRVWVMQAGHYGRTLGRAEIAFDPKTKRVSIERYRIIDVDASLPVSEEVDALATRLEREATPDAHDVVATLRQDLRAGHELAQLVHRAATQEWGVDASLVARDAFWASLPKGPVTLQRLYDSVMTQRQPTGTPGFTSMYTVELTGAELRSLATRMRSPLHELFLPPTLEPKKTYKLAIEKRAMAFPRAVFGVDPKLPEPTFAGELIDVLESYARARTRSGVTLD
ncbi:MAG: bifunctional metallophosphatase/5'-nucleotidase [Deltaproteobacteria bacterium]|nr:bifunctional metallophosphatase/5'-nucleotidase [Deltaproteobacteria bacterium]